MVAHNNNENVLFEAKLNYPHGRVNPCFMTGKGCVHTDAIDQSIRDRKSQNKYLGFSVMPFRGNLNVFFKNCLQEYFSFNYPNTVILQRADEVRRPGIIICEGICKRIQESDFVTVDISVPNPNVFYELGLAYGMGHKIILIRHDGAMFGDKMADNLAALDCHPYIYHDLDPIKKEELDLGQYVWQKHFQENFFKNREQHIYLYEHFLEDYSIENERNTEDSDDITLDFQTHLRSAVGLSVQKIQNDIEFNKESQSVLNSYLPNIGDFKIVQIIKPERSLSEIQSQVDSAYCLMIRTGFRGCHPMTYFWLGYGHARGKNVIPITILHKRNESVRDLAFDIRAQRHMFFIRSMPERFEGELMPSLKQMIVSDFSDWSRKRFWNHMIGKRGEVSVFIGALHNDRFGREMIGDWDLRSASELTSYFAGQQYRAKIENPVYAFEYARRGESVSKNLYIKTLKEALRGKNCIIIASPDVNPLTEIILGHVYHVPEEQLFKRSTRIFPDAIVAVKEIRSSKTEKKDGSEKDGVAERYFYQEININEDKPLRRGFRSTQFSDEQILEEFVSQVDERQRGFKVFGHLLILPNIIDGQDNDGKFIIVLNGVSGPATFALTHVLTGGVTKEFVSYGDKFNPEAESEKILSSVLELITRPNFRLLDCIITVGVDTSASGPKTNDATISDWRKIRNWSLNKTARQYAIRALP